MKSSRIAACLRDASNSFVNCRILESCFEQYVGVPELHSRVRAFHSYYHKGTNNYYFTDSVCTYQSSSRKNIYLLLGIKIIFEELFI
jgi:hypothetical protein